MVEAFPINSSQGRVSAPISRIQFDSVLEVGNRFGEIVRRVKPIMRPTTKERIIGFRAISFLPGLPNLLSRRQIDCKGSYDAARNLVL